MKDKARQPVVPLGTYVRAALAGWDEGRRGFDSEGPDYPTLEGCPRFVEGPLEGWYVESLDYFKHCIGEFDIEEATIRPIDPAEAGAGSLAWNAPALLWPREALRRKKYRALQSWYRETILCTPPGVHPRSGRPLGSLLPELAADEGLNFIHSGIYEYVQRRVPQVLGEKGTISVSRLKSNMLSSMPLAFNLFGHLRNWPNPLTAALNEVLGIPVTKIRRVEVEYAPQPIERFLGDRTAFDAYIEYSYKGKLGFVGIETKYTEPFTRTVFDKNPRYAELTTPEFGFADGAIERLKESATNQLWRNTLLAKALLHVDGFHEGHVVVLACRDDTTASAAVAGLQTELGNDGMVRPLVTFDEFIEPCFEYLGSGYWANEFRQRYLDLGPVASALGHFQDHSQVRREKSEI